MRGTKVWLHRVLGVLAAFARAWPLLPMLSLLFPCCKILRNECDVA